MHKKIDYVMRVFRACSRVVFKSHQQHSKLVANGFGAPAPAGLSAVLEADVKHIVNLARDTFEKCEFLVPYYIN